MWSPPAAPALSVTRTARANAVVVELRGVFRVVPITAEDSRVHGYGVTEDDCRLAHLDLGFKFYDLTDDVHGVLGQTYRTDYVNRLNVTAKMPVMGWEAPTPSAPRDSSTPTARSPGSSDAATTAPPLRQPPAPASPWSLHDAKYL